MFNILPKSSHEFSSRFVSGKYNGNSGKYSMELFLNLRSGKTIQLSSNLNHNSLIRTRTFQSRELNNPLKRTSSVIPDSPILQQNRATGGPISTIRINFHSMVIIIRSFAKYDQSEKCLIVGRHLNLITTRSSTSSRNYHRLQQPACTTT